MPLQQRIRLYREFIHHEFLVNFRRIFRFRKENFILSKTEDPDHDLSERYRDMMEEKKKKRKVREQRRQSKLMVKI